MPLFTLSLVTMAAAQLFDLATFAAMVERVGPHAEVNPIVQSMLGSLGVTPVAITKALLVILVGSVAIILTNHGDKTAHRWVARSVVTVAILAGLLGGLTNAMTIWA
jgi:hypothetical protein